MPVLRVFLMFSGASFMMETIGAARMLVWGPPVEKYMGVCMGSDTCTIVPMTDPDAVLIHATTRNAWKIIKTEGLSRMLRTHIHFGTSFPTGNGRRAQMAVRIVVDVGMAIADGIKFFTSAEGIVLCRGNEEGYLLPKYFALVMEKNGKPLA